MKHPWILLFIVFALIKPTAGAAGAEHSGGGHAWVCRDADQNIVSADLLDIFEGQYLYGFRIKGSNDAVDSQLRLAYERIKRLTHFSSGYLDVQRTVASRMRVLPEGVRLDLIQDAFPVFSKDGCQFEQLAISTDWGELLVDKELYDFFLAKDRGSTDLAALIVHETTYRMIRAIKTAASSKEARRLVAAIFSDTPTLSHMVRRAFPRPATPAALVRVKDSHTPGRAIASLTFGARQYTSKGVVYSSDAVVTDYRLKGFNQSSGEVWEIASGNCESVVGLWPCVFIYDERLLQDGSFLVVEANLLDRRGWYIDLHVGGFIDAVVDKKKMSSGGGTSGIFAIKLWQP